MAEHTCMDKLDANTKRSLESIEKAQLRSLALLEQIKAQLETLFQQHNFSLSSLRGATNSPKNTLTQPVQSHVTYTTTSDSQHDASESLNVVLSIPDEFPCSSKQSAVPSVCKNSLMVDSVTLTSDFPGDTLDLQETATKTVIAATESFRSNTIAVDQGEIFPSIEPNEASVGRLSRSWESVEHHQREVQLAQIDSESTTETTPSLYSTIATIPLLEPEDAALISEWRRTTDSPRPEKRCAGSKSKCLYHARRNNPTPSSPPKPPDWTHAVANPPPPPEPPDLRCCGVAGRRFYLTPPYRACHIHGCLGILEQFDAYYYKNIVLRLNSDLEASLAQSLVESYQTLLAQSVGYCIVNDKIFRTAVGMGLLRDDQNCRQQIFVVDVIQNDVYEPPMINKDTDCKNHVPSFSLQTLEIMPVFPYVASLSCLVPDTYRILRSLFKGSVAYLSHGVTTKLHLPKPPDGVAIPMPPWESLILKLTIDHRRNHLN